MSRTQRFLDVVHRTVGSNQKSKDYINSYRNYLALKTQVTGELIESMSLSFLGNDKLGVNLSANKGQKQGPNIQTFSNKDKIGEILDEVNNVVENDGQVYTEEDVNLALQYMSDNGIDGAHNFIDDMEFEEVIALLGSYFQAKHDSKATLANDIKSAPIYTKVGGIISADELNFGLYFTNILEDVTDELDLTRLIDITEQYKEVTLNSFSDMIESYQQSQVIDDALEMLENSSEEVLLRGTDLITRFQSKVTVMFQSTTALMDNFATVLDDTTLDIGMKIGIITDPISRIIAPSGEIVDLELPEMIEIDDGQFTGVTPALAWVSSIDVDWSKPLSTIYSAAKVGIKAIGAAFVGLGKLISWGAKKVKSYVVDTVIDPTDLIVNKGFGLDSLVDLYHEFSVEYKVTDWEWEYVVKDLRTDSYRDIITPFGRISSILTFKNPHEVQVRNFVYLNPTEPIRWNEVFSDPSELMYPAILFKSVPKGDSFGASSIINGFNIDMGTMLPDPFPVHGVGKPLEFMEKIFHGHSWDDYAPDYSNKEDEYWLKALISSKVRMDWYLAMMNLYNFSVTYSKFHSRNPFSAIAAILDYSVNQENVLMDAGTNNPFETPLYSLDRQQAIADYYGYSLAEAKQLMIDVQTRLPLVWEEYPGMYTVSSYVTRFHSDGDAPYTIQEWWGQRLYGVVSVDGLDNWTFAGMISNGEPQKYITNFDFYSVSTSRIPGVTYPVVDGNSDMWQEKSFFITFDFGYWQSYDGIREAMEIGLEPIFMPYTRRTRDFKFKFEVATDSHNGRKFARLLIGIAVTVVVVVIGVKLLKYRKNLSSKIQRNKSLISKMEKELATIDPDAVDPITGKNVGLEQLNSYTKSIRKLKRKTNRMNKIGSILGVKGVKQVTQLFNEDTMDITGTVGQMLGVNAVSDLNQTNAIIELIGGHVILNE